MSPLGQRPARKRPAPDYNISVLSEQQLAFLNDEEGPARKRAAPHGKSPGNGRLKWSREMRRFLNELYAQTLELNLRFRLFQKRFETEIKACGAWTGFTCNSLKTQYQEKRKGQNKDWIAIASPDKEEARLQSLVEREVQELLGEAADSDTVAEPEPTRQPAISKRQTLPRTVATTSSTTTITRKTAIVPPTALARQSRLQYKPQTPLRKQRPIATLRPSNDQVSEDEDTIIVGSPSLSRFALASPPKTPIRRIPPSNTSTRRAELGTPHKADIGTTDPQRIPFSRPGDQGRGGPIMLSPKAFDLANSTVIPVTPQLAHPNTGPLFFRFFDPVSQAHLLTLDGSIMSRFHANFNLLGKQPPLCSNIDLFYHIANHIGGERKEGPLISISNSLWWLLRRALYTEREAKGADLVIIVIAANKLDQKGIYHVPSYLTQLRLKKVFHNGDWNYSGKHEWLVHQIIPSAAILHSFKLSGLKDFLALQPENILRLDILSSPGSGKARHIQKRREQGILYYITPQIVQFIARLASFMGLHSNAKIDQIAYIVEEVLHGWDIKLKSAVADWAHLARTFSRELLKLRDSALPSRHALELEQAFCNGVLYACIGTNDINPRHSAKDMRSIYRKAATLGLGSTVKRRSTVTGFVNRTQVVLDSMEAAQSAIQRSVDNEEAMFSNMNQAVVPSRSLLASRRDERHEMAQRRDTERIAALIEQQRDEAEEGDDDIDDEELSATPTPPTRRAHVSLTRATEQDVDQISYQDEDEMDAEMEDGFVLQSDV